MRMDVPNGLGLSLVDEVPLPIPSALSPSPMCKAQAPDPRRLELSQLCAHARSRRQSALSTRPAHVDGGSDSSLPALMADLSSGTSSTDSGSDSDGLAPGPNSKALPVRRTLSALPLAEKRNQVRTDSASSSDGEFAPRWRRGPPSSTLAPRVVSGGRALGLRGVSMAQDGDRYTTPVSTFSHRRVCSGLPACPSPQPLTHAAGLGRGFPRRPAVSMSNTSPPSSSDESWGSTGTTVMRSTSSPSPPSSPVPMLAIELTITPPTPKMKTNLLPFQEQREAETGRVHSVSLRSSAAPPPQEAYRYPTPMARFYAHTLSLPPPPFDVAPGRNIKLHDRMQHERDHLQLLLDAQQVIEQRLKEHHSTGGTQGPTQLQPPSSSSEAKTEATEQAPTPPRVVRTNRLVPISPTPTRGARSLSSLVPGTPRLPSSSASNSLPRRVPSQRLMRPMAPSSSESSSSSDEDDFAARFTRGVGERAHSSLPANRLAALRTLALAQASSASSSSSSSSDSASSDEDSNGVQKRRLARTNMLRRLGQRAGRASP